MKIIWKLRYFWRKIIGRIDRPVPLVYTFSPCNSDIYTGYYKAWSGKGYLTLKEMAKDSYGFDLPYLATTDGYVTIYFTDGTTKQTDLKQFIQENSVNLEEVEKEIDRKIEISKATEMIRVVPGWFVTGCCPYHLLPRKDLINREIELRKWSWKQF